MINKFTILVVGPLFLFLIFHTSSSKAQTPPTSLPLVQQADMVYLGKFTVPWNDGTGRGNSVDSLDYGGWAIGMGADGTSIYYGCHDWYSMLARVSIPAIGGTGTIRMPCTAVTNLQSINPGDPNNKKLGSSLVWNGKLIVSAYSFYDGNSTAIASHFSMSPDMATQNGPYRIGPLSGYTAIPTDKVGMQAGYMALVPQEWRALLGGPVLTGLSGVAIIGRTSFGPTATIFDPDELGTSNHNMQMLVGYPGEHQDLGGYSQSNQYFAGADQHGGMAFPAGTRTLLFVGRHATTFCYGPGTSDPALAGTSDGQGNLYCYDPTQTSKGTHGYPYIHQVWAYDANDLLAVKNGTKQPWELRPYAVWRLTDMNNTGDAYPITSATFDPTTKRFYMVQGLNVHVYQINVGTVSNNPIVDIKANSSDSLTISSGASATISWTSSNVSSCSVSPGGWSGASGTQSGGVLTTTTTYNILCTGVNGTATDSVVVTVTAPPPPPQQEPIAHWKLDETSGTTAIDSSNGNNNGNLLNGPVWGVGQMGGALIFDGVNDYVDIQDPVSLRPTSFISMSGWAKFDRLDATQKILSKDNGTNQATGIRFQNGGSVRCIIGGTSINTSVLITNTNTWYHIACTYDGSNIVVYVDGVSRATLARNGAIGDQTGASWNIGRRSNSELYLSGSIDDVRIYNRALSGAEVSSLYSGASNTLQRTIQIDPEGRTSKVLTGTLNVLNTSKTSIKTYPFTTNSSGQATITFDIAPQVVYLKLNPIPFLSRLLSLDLNTNTTYTFPKLLVGDINQDNLINSIDYSGLNSKWFTSDATSDLNKDGLVNSIDFSFMNRNWLVGGEV